MTLQTSMPAGHRRIAPMTLTITLWLAVLAAICPDVASMPFFGITVPLQATWSRDVMPKSDQLHLITSNVIGLFDNAKQLEESAVWSFPYARMISNEVTAHVKSEAGHHVNGTWVLEELYFYNTTQSPEKAKGLSIAEAEAAVANAESVGPAHHLNGALFASFHPSIHRYFINDTGVYRTTYSFAKDADVEQYKYTSHDMATIAFDTLTEAHTGKLKVDIDAKKAEMKVDEIIAGTAMEHPTVETSSATFAKDSMSLKGKFFTHQAESVHLDLLRIHVPTNTNTIVRRK
eukprot:GFYU01008874.1.p1 GENE.GFYU01008874.1~~GFYU01008874.1.p1  ORF type:complete len:289 (+),score=80.61 GFYU01008874.1:163-1029(+)